MSKRINVGVLGSTRGTDLVPLLKAISDGVLNASINVVVSNRKSAYILERAKNAQIPAYFISHKEKTRQNFDAEITTLLEKHDVELVLLIGFMRILSPEFCERWKDRVLNVHPSLLPKYAGGMDMNVHEEVLQSGDTVTGCTVHYVSADVDQGPILIQERCDVLPGDTPDTLKTRVQELEGVAFIKAIKLIQDKLC